MLVGANYFRGEQLEYSRVPAVFREYILRVLAVFWDSVRRIPSILPSISGFDAADTPVLAVLLLLILRALAVFSAFGTAHTPRTRGIQAFSTAHSPSTRSLKCTRYSILPSILEVVRSTTWSICVVFSAQLCSFFFWLMGLSRLKNFPNTVGCFTFLQSSSVV